LFNRRECDGVELSVGHIALHDATTEVTVADKAEVLIASCDHRGVLV